MLKPVFDESSNCIVLCSNNAFMPVASVLIQSMYQYKNKESKYDVIVLHRDVNIFTQKHISDTYNGDSFSVRFFDVSKYITGRDFFVENRKNFTEEAYYRLLIPWILDNEYEKALYLDSDMIVLGDIYDIFKNDLGENQIAAVRDYWGICNCYIEGDSRKSYRESIGLYDIDDYIISSTIIFDLDKIRSTYNLNDVLDLASSRNWEQHDQDVINVLFKNKIMHISARYGLAGDYGNNHYLPEYLLKELELAEKNPIVIHYAGRRKPWISYYTDYHMEFWNLAYKTKYFSTLLEKAKSIEYRNFIANNVCREAITEQYTCNDVKKYFAGCSLGSLATGHTKYTKIEIKGNTLFLDGFLTFYGISAESEIEVFIIINGKWTKVSEINVENSYDDVTGVIRYNGIRFSTCVCIDDTIEQYNIRIGCSIDGIYVEKCNLDFEEFCALTNKLKNTYSKFGKWYVTSNFKELLIKKSKGKIFEWNLVKELFELNTKPALKAIFVRIATSFAKAIKRKKIILISDRLFKADDNGEAFFKYIVSQEDVVSYFVIHGKSSDYERLKKIGNVVEAMSIKHKFLHLLSDCLISSHTDRWFRNPFGKSAYLYKDILSKKDFVFLQHGVISNDLSRWFSKSKTFIKGFITSLPREYKSILDGDYNYSENEVWLTGLPRFDYLENEDEKIITFLPTWRKWLAKNFEEKKGTWNVFSNFSESNYVKSYNRLINNEKLKQKAKELGYRIKFKMHPAFTGYEKQFAFEDDTVLLDTNISYNEIYRKSKLIVTDYSSSIYDFVYMNKPIVYYQFDSEEFFSGKHSYTKGDFDYERDGFGEVCYDEETIVELLIEYMESDCKLKNKYSERIEKAFAFRDKNNCKRIYKNIKTMFEKKNYE